MLHEVPFNAQQVTNLELINSLQSNLLPQLGQPFNVHHKSDVMCLPVVLPSLVGVSVEVQK